MNTNPYAAMAQPSGKMIQVTPEEEKMLIAFREEQRIKKGYNQAISEVVFRLSSMAEECGGGSGAGGDVYRMLADKFDKLTKK